MKEFSGKKITVLGLGRSGLAAALLLKRIGADVFVSELGDSPQLRENGQVLFSGRIRFELGRHSKETIVKSDCIVISPGISNDADIVKWARQKGIPIISEIELGFLLCPGKIVAITGTNGKTTVTTLLGKVISAAGYRCFTCGNIGRPFCLDVPDIKDSDYVALEVSSFQLENTYRFKPKAAVILNLTCDHMDRYGDMKEYLEAKKKIFANQDGSDFLILNYDDPLLMPLKDEIKSKVSFFRNRIEDSEGFRLNPNHLAVLAAAEALGIHRQICIEVFKEFKGVEHRLELVRSINDIFFINDSKATNVDSTIWALDNLAEPVILIAGGRDKNCNLEPIRSLMKQKVRHMVLVGEAQEKFYEFFNGVVSLEKVSGFEEGIRAAYARAKAGDCVLLSPMCASFDMFDNYEHRGRVFKEIVNRL